MAADTTRDADDFDVATAARAALDVLVFAPIGLGVKLVDDAPAAVRTARQELSNARFIGRMTVSQGFAQMRARAATTAEADHAEDEPVPEAQEAAETPEMVTVLPLVGDLALPDYDHLPAIDIVAKLDGLTDGERDAITAYESANRQRRTVLGKLQQLSDFG